FQLNKNERKEVTIQSEKTSYEAWVFSKEDIMKIVELDLDTVYLKCKGSVWKQKQGCPMGGFLSAMYANIKCFHDESIFIRNLKKQARRIYAIRQIDDLIMWVAYDNKDRSSKDWAEK